MIRTFILLCLVAAPALGFYNSSLKVRYGSFSGNGITSFIPMPQNKSIAVDRGWVQTERPEGPDGLESLEMWCPKCDYTICILYDDTGYVAGLQLAFDKDKVSNSVFDWNVQGCTNWTTTQDGITKQFYTNQQYYISKESLATEAATRIAARNSSLLLQDGNVWVSGFNGELFNISTNANYVTGEDSIYTKQNCVAGMGYHYYYNMTAYTECTAEALFPWFPLIYDGQLIGIGFNVFTEYTVESGSMNWFEYSSETILRYTVPNGPECAYELGRDVGQVTLHIYYVDTPYIITC